MPADTPPAPPRVILGLRPKEAAAALGISPRTLFTLTRRGEVEHVRIGNCVIYPVESLRRFLADRAAKGEQP